MIKPNICPLLVACIAVLSGLLTYPALADYSNDFESDSVGAFSDEGFSTANAGPSTGVLDPDIRMLIVDQNAVGTDPFLAPDRPADPFGGAGNQSLMLEDQSTGPFHADWKLSNVNGVGTNVETGTFSVDLMNSTFGGENSYSWIRLRDSINGNEAVGFVMVDGFMNVGASETPLTNVFDDEVPYNVTIELDGVNKEWSGTVTNLITSVAEPMTALIGGATTFSFGAGANGVGDISFDGGFSTRVGVRLFVDNISLTSPSAALLGDFNEDGTVDAADYTVWRDNEGSGTALPNDNGLGTPIGAAHYSLWTSNFGIGASQSAAIPEPSSVSLLALILVGMIRREASRI